MASDINGYITIFDINLPGKEKLAKRIGNTIGRPKQRVVIWRDHGREIISGDEEGMVTFWYSKEGTPLFVLKAHNGPVTQMRWNEELQQLITCSKDKTIKVWHLPDRWIDESSKSKDYQESSTKDSGIEESAWAQSSSSYTSPTKTLNEKDFMEKSVASRSPAKDPLMALKRRDSSDDDDLGGAFK